MGEIIVKGKTSRLMIFLITFFVTLPVWPRGCSRAQWHLSGGNLAAGTFWSVVTLAGFIGAYIFIGWIWRRIFDK